MKVQTYDSKQQALSRGPGVIMSPEVAGAVGQSVANLGNTLTDVTQQYWEAQRKADRVVDYHGAVTAMHKTLNDVLAQLENDPDEEGYQQKFQDAFNQTRESVLSGIEDEETKRVIHMTFDEMQVKGSGQVQKMAMVRKAQKGRAKLLMDYEYWKNAGDLERVKSILNDGVQAMLFKPEEATKYGLRAEHEVWVSRARNDIKLGAFDKAKYSALDQQTLLLLEGEAQDEQRRREYEQERKEKQIKEETGSQALDLWGAGKLTQGWLNEQHKARRLSDQYYEHFTKALKEGSFTGEGNLKTYIALRTGIINGEMRDYTEIVKHLGQLGKVNAERLMDMVDAYNLAEGRAEEKVAAMEEKAANSAIQRATLESISRAKLDAFLDDALWLDSRKDKVRALFDRNIALVDNSQIKIFTDSMIKDLQDASYSEMMAKLNQSFTIIEKQRKQAAAVPRKKTPPTAKLPPRITTDAEYNALPSGTEFIGPDGKKRRKP